MYFGKDDGRIVILLGGGTKQRQQDDIRLAVERWGGYKQRKKEQKEGDWMSLVMSSMGLLL